jgi:hypothetical protein
MHLGVRVLVCRVAPASGRLRSRRDGGATKFGHDPTREALTRAFPPGWTQP